MKGEILIPDLRIHYRNPLIPEGIKKVFTSSKTNDFKFDLSIRFGNESIYCNSFFWNSFQGFIKNENDNLKKELLKDFINGFKNGYIESKFKSDFEISKASIGELNAIGYDSSYSIYSEVYNSELDEHKIETYEQGYDHGKIYKAIEIILNDPFRFKMYFKKDIVKKQIKKPKIKDNEIWFQVGLKFATGELPISKNQNYTKLAKEYFSELKTKNGNSARPYITATCNDYKTDKNIYSKEDKLQKIIDYCKENQINICETFIEKIPKNFFLDI